MIPFLLWAATSTAPAPDPVAARLTALLAEWFVAPPAPRILRHPAFHLVWAPPAVEGWTAPADEVAGLERCLAFEYPLNRADLAPSLGALARALARDDGRLLAEITPPMSLLHVRPDAAWLFTDGLGAAQLFLHRHARGWALTNRLVFLEALGVPLQLQAEDWALRLSLPYFPDDRTGFRDIVYVPPGTRYRLDRDGLHGDRLDAVGRWLHAAPQSLPAWLDAVDAAVRGYLRHAARVTPEFSCGLSGGWDSRAVVAAVRRAGHPFRLRTKGPVDSPDVTVARQLAERAGLALRIKPDSEGAPDPADLDDVRRALRLALRWQAGAMIVHKHKTLFARGQRFTDAVVNVMGQYGEVVRARLLRLLGGRVPDETEAAATYAAVVTGLLAKAPRFWRGAVAAQVHAETTRLARAVPEGLPTLAQRLEAFYMLQDVRRWTTGALRAQATVTLTPWLTPTTLRAALHAPPEARLGDRFQRELVQRHAPDWAGIPVAATIGRGASRYFDNHRFWAAVGWDGMRRLSAGGLDFAATLCDPAALEASWLDHPDEAAVLLSLPGAFGG